MAPCLDGWRLKEMIAPIFTSGDTELQEKLRRHVMLPYIMADFIPEHKSELAGAKSFAYFKPNGVDLVPATPQHTQRDQQTRLHHTTHSSNLPNVPCHL